MKNMRKEKGITLIALILTVIVLLILAVVSISTIQNQGIIEHANSSTTKYNEAVNNEIDVLGSYEELENEYVNKYTGENDKKEDTSVEGPTTGSDSNLNDDDEWTKNY